MAQAQMRMPRHGYRPDGSKPYGPHGPMAPPTHLKVNNFSKLFYTEHCYLCLISLCRYVINLTDLILNHQSLKIKINVCVFLLALFFYLYFL